MSVARVVTLSVVLCSSLAFAQGGECVPACRSGYFCHQSQCISRCNPACPEGSQCLDTGECTAVAPTAVPTVTPVGQRVNQGWAAGAGVLGLVSAGVVAVLTATTIVLNGTDAANYTGAITLLTGAISVPLVAVGVGSGRWDPSIRGAVGWRILGWVSFGLAMATGVVALGLGVAGVTVPSYLIATLGGLGVLSAVSLAIDAFTVASEGRALARSASVWRHQPLFALAPDGRGGVTPLVGWAAAF